MSVPANPTTIPSTSVLRIICRGYGSDTIEVRTSSPRSPSASEKTRISGNTVRRSRIETTTMVMINVGTSRPCLRLLRIVRRISRAVAVFSVPGCGGMAPAIGAVLIVFVSLPFLVEDYFDGGATTSLSNRLVNSARFSPASVKFHFRRLTSSSLVMRGSSLASGWVCAW